MRRGASRLLTALVCAGAVLVPTAAVAAPATTASISVQGDVSAPSTLGAEQLAALPQLTLPVRGSTVSGASLEAAVLAATPTTPAGAKNALLRVSVTVVGRGLSAVTFALGELDSGFGNRPAVLTTATTGRVDLVVPGDNTGVARRGGGLRSIRDVTRLVVRVASDPQLAGPAGSVVVTDGSRSATLSPGLLAALPARTTTVTFQAGTAQQQHTEQGPALWLVLLAAGFLPGPTTAVSAVADDGYIATVTPFEQLAGGRRLSLSLVEDGVALTQPRLIVDGDLKGGRYVSGVLTLVVSSGRR